MSVITIIVVAALAFVAWHFIPKRPSPQPTRKYRSEPRAVATDPNWQTFIEEHCESPAEKAFLRAMIKGHGLLPNNGSLKAQNLKIDFQVKVANYRLDFLANDWLIIEIDGAAWHSSEKAKQRDAARDDFFVERGYAVLRIPAKIVFSEPGEAVRRVNSALAAGRPKLEEPVHHTGIERLRQTASSTRKAVSELSSRLDRQRRVDEALRNVRLVFDREKHVLSKAFEAAETKIRIEDTLSADPELRSIYNFSRSRIDCVATTTMAG